MVFKVRQIIKRLLYQVAQTLNPWEVYHSFPFNHNSPMAGELGEVMRSCCDVLEYLGIRYRLTDGTILGLHREGDFIKHDNDIDVDIMFPCAVDEIESSMNKIEMNLGRKVVYKSKPQQLVYYSADQMIFDMVFWGKKGGSVVNYAEEGYERMQPARFFDRLGMIEFQERVYPCPSDLEDWLGMRYGKDWRTPKTYKGDWKEDCYDMHQIWWSIRLYKDVLKLYRKMVNKVRGWYRVCSFDKNVRNINGTLDILSSYFRSIPEYSSNFLVDLTIIDPEYYHVTLISSRAISEILKSQPVALVPSHIGPEYMDLIKSYGISKFVATDDIRLPFCTKVKARLFSLYSFLIHRSKNGLLKMKYKYCPIGYFVYDSYLRSMGEGTVNVHDLEYIKFIYGAVLLFHKYQMVFDEKRYNLYFASEPRYIGGGISSTVAIRKGVKVIVRKGGPARVCARLYQNLASLNVGPHHPDLEQYQDLLDSENIEAIEWANTYIENLTKGIVDECDYNAVNAYRNSRDLMRDEFLSMFPDKSEYKYMVVIMSHIFTDAVHGYWDMLFVDYATWLRRTLEIATRRNDVLWIVKPHPSESNYKLNTTAYDIYKKFKRYRNIKFLPAGVSIISLTDIIDAIVTVRGTAAIEYSCLGIPVIMAGSSPFDGGEFCRKPKSEEEYEKLLLYGEFRGLSEAEIHRAKVSLYIYKKQMLIDLPFLNTYDGGSDYNDFVDHLIKVISNEEDVSVTWMRYKDYLKRILT